MNDFEYDVFLSHSNADKPIVRELAQRLRSDGLRVWFDEWQLRPGDNIPAAIEAGLERSRLLILCMSGHTLRSDWSRLEANTFRFRDPLNRSRRLLPLRLDETPPRDSLAQFVHISWLPSERTDAYVHLLRALGSSGSGRPGLLQPAIANLQAAEPVTNELRRRLREDYANTCLTPNLQHEFRELTERLRQAGLISTADRRIPNISRRIPQPKLEDIPLLAARLRTSVREIELATSSIYAAPCAAVLQLKDTLARFDVSLTADPSAPSGHSMAMRLKSGEQGTPDFLILSPAIFFMLGSRRLAPYRLLLPCNRLEQRLFARNNSGAGKTGRLLILADSTCELQHRLGVATPRLHKEVPIYDVEAVPHQVEHMEPGDMIYAWEPMASILRCRPEEFTVMPNSLHHNYPSLFCHRKWMHPSMKPARDAFLALFQHAWTRASLQPLETQAIELGRFPGFLQSFKTGSGMPIH